MRQRQAHVPREILPGLVGEYNIVHCTIETASFDSERTLTGEASQARGSTFNPLGKPQYTAKS
jgi:hypothetical protein